MKNESFLKSKLKNIKIGTILFNELEAWVQFLFGSIPGNVGFLVRNIVYRPLFKKSKGLMYIQPRVTFVNMHRIEVDRNFGVNSGTYLNGLGGIKIGSNVVLGSNVTVSSGVHPTEGREKSVFERPCIPREIIIEDDVWLGAGVTVVPGVIIQTGSVIGANSVVTKNTERYSVNVGVPAKLMKHR